MGGHPELWLANELSWFEHITPESIRSALVGFPLASKFSDRWMAGHVRRVYLSTVGDGIEDYPGQASVRAELGQIVSALDAVIGQISARSGWAESVLRRHAAITRHEQGADWFSSDEANSFSNDLSDVEKRDPLYQCELSRGEWWAEGGVMLARVSPEWHAFREALMGIRSARAYIYQANAALCSREDPPRWRDQERRKARISFATWLSAVFETAFDKAATVNSWTDDSGNAKLGHWPDFFARVGSVALKVERIPDLERTLKEARREYKSQRADILARDFSGENHP
jgi:hypothetical protein